ncbi:putative F-box protein At1g50870 [Lolium perenne]|uniref:putative F-box protein At1g50870 n=1 Tax=Lolium perenne TaxID=4522 RepID=UPI003A990F7D
MASQEACSTAAPCGTAASSVGFLPADVIYDVLLHLPAKTLCRFRAVSRSWRSLLTTDPHFAGAHASRHPHVVALFFDEKDSRCHADTFDLSGNRIRRVTLNESSSAITGLCTHGNLACLTRNGVGPNRVRLINLATGVASAFPGPDVVGIAVYMLGQVASSGEHKLLCVDVGYEQCHVLVLGLGGGGHPRWRRKESPPVRLTHYIFFAGHSAVVQGTVYCLADPHSDSGIYKDSMVSFNLETEEWAPTVLAGPLGDRLNSGRRPLVYDGISLAELSGYLVTAHTDEYTWSMDLWFLVEGQWCKRHHIWLNVIFDSLHPRPVPLFVFDDGRILLRAYDEFKTMKRLLVLRVYDTTTKTKTGETTDIRGWSATGLCKGSLLLCP